MKNLIILAIEHCCELGQISYRNHEEVAIWREKPLDKGQINVIANKGEYALKKQREWLDAIKLAIEGR